MSDHRIIFGLLIVLILLGALRLFQKWNADDGIPFQAMDLFMENGRASKGAVILMGAFAATTWFFVYYALTGRMTETFFGLYAGAWITPTVARLIKGPPPEAPAATP